jgi:hypothetical protein
MWCEWFPQLPPDILQEAVLSFPKDADSQCVFEYCANELADAHQKLTTAIFLLKEKENTQVVSEAIGVVLHSVKNLLDNPFETKFWKIKLENKAFHSKVGRRIDRDCKV